MLCLREKQIQTSMLEMNEKIHDSRRIRGHFISLLFPVELVGQNDLFEDFSTKSNAIPGECRWHGEPPNNLIPQHEIYKKFF